MSKEKWKSMGIILLIFILTVNVVLLMKVTKELGDVRSKLSGMENNLQSRMDTISYEMRSRLEALEESQKKEQSLLSDSSLDYKLQGDKILVTIKAVPKEISETETLYARIYAGDQVYEEEMDRDGRVQIPVEMAETIRPVILIKSEGKTRQETLGEQYTGNMFEAQVYSTWEDANKEKWGYTIWISPGDYGLPFDPDQVEKAEFVVQNTGNKQNFDGQSAETAASSAAVEVDESEGERLFTEEAGDRIEAVKMKVSSKDQIGYYADLSQYADRNDSMQYLVYFCLTARDGLRFYTPYESVSDFCTDGTHSSKSCGSGRLVPVFP